MIKNSIQLYKTVMLSDFIIPSISSGTSYPKMVEKFNLELASLGYTLSPSLYRTFQNGTLGSIKKNRQLILDELIKITGADSNHQTLFAKFPYDTPNQLDYLIRRVVGFIQNIFPEEKNVKDTVLSCGHAIDSALFKVEDFGACPICQFQVDELTYDADATEVHPYERLTKLKVLHARSGPWFGRKGEALLGRMSSLSMQEREFLLDVKEYIKKKPTEVYRENLPFVYDFFDGDVASLIKGATDVLRIATYLSNKEADLSLATNTKFKLTTSQKKNLLKILNDTGNLEEDFMRHREKWLRLGEILNPGSEKNKERYPLVYKAFNALRNAPQKIVTYGREIETNFRAGVFNKATLNMVATRPGDFIRKYDWMLRSASRPSFVVKALKEIVPEINTRMLFDFEKYLTWRGQGNHGDRLFFPKGMVNKVQMVPDTRKALPEEYLVNTYFVLSDELKRRFKKLPRLGKVYVDPNLSNLLLPFNRRGDSASTENIIKGSHYPLEDAPVLRFFVHWTGHIDVDLSVLYYDENMEQAGYVSYHNLHDTGVKHSGDIQDAPNGASEFIDIDLEKVMTKGIRYVVSSVISFRGQNFNSFPCYMGYMGRDSITSGKTFEPSSVRIKMELDANATHATPMIFDLIERKVIFTDLAMGQGRFGAVARQSEKNKAVLKNFLTLPSRKTTVEDVIATHVMARKGKLVDTAKEADIVFKADLDIDQFMKEYVGE